MDKINILWIEDNPLQESLYVRDLINRDSELKKIFSTDLYGEVIPAIHLGGDLEEYHKYFHLQVLQHPVEIKDFVTMCLKLEDAMGGAAFSKLEVLPPEVIAFDYHFGTKITINQGSGAMLYDPKLLAIRKYINPNFKFKDKEKTGKLFSDKEFLLEKEESENYTQDDFLIEISKVKTFDEVKPKDKEGLVEDDFGLFSAIEILRIFREHPTVAIPATYNKNEVEKLTLHGKYFEWLNEYDYSVDFQREERGSKKWDSILKDAVKALRKKIETHLKLGKITPSLNELLDNVDGTISDKGIFTFTSSYGNRKLPLNGLFIDFPKQKRNEEIKKYAKQLLETLASATNTTVDEIKGAKEMFGILWKKYCDDFEDRIILSDYTKRENELDDNSKQILNEIRKKFGVNVSKKTISENHLCSIQNFDNKTYSILAKKLTILLIATKVHIQFEKMRSKSGYKMEYIEPSKEEYYYLLNPICNVLKNNGIILPIHLGGNSADPIDAFGKWLEYQTKSTSHPIDRGEWYLFEKWVTAGQKILVRALLEEELEELKTLPRWL